MPPEDGGEQSKGVRRLETPDTRAPFATAISNARRPGFEKDKNMNLARLFRSPVSTIALGAVVLLTGVLNLPPAPGKAETNWTDCGDGWECASIEVPLDYDHLNQSTVQLELSRLPAAGPGPRLGSLLFNFGGPGASTIDILPGIVEFLAPEVRQRFDLVAFDPRGVGHSSPIRCNQNVANFWGLDGTPDDEAEWNELVAEAKVMATNCSANGELLVLTQESKQAI